MVDTSSSSEHKYGAVSASSLYSFQKPEDAFDWQREGYALKDETYAQETARFQQTAYLDEREACVKEKARLERQGYKLSDTDSRDVGMNYDNPSIIPQKYVDYVTGVADGVIEASKDGNTVRAGIFLAGKYKSQEVNGTGLYTMPPKLYLPDGINTDRLNNFSQRLSQSMYPETSVRNIRSLMLVGGGNKQLVDMDSSLSDKLIEIGLQFYDKGFDPAKEKRSETKTMVEKYTKGVPSSRASFVEQTRGDGEIKR